MKQLSNKHYSAFTLTELMTVIVIIGILAAVAVPSYRFYTVEARLSEGYVLLDAIKKVQMTYHAENGVFHYGILVDAGDQDQGVQDILDGKKITPNPTSAFMSEAGNVVAEPINFWVNIVDGGFNEATQVAHDHADGDVKIMYAGVTTGSSCNSTYFGMKANEFGVEDGSADTTYDWFVTTAVLNAAYPTSDNCIYLVQKVDTHGDGYNTAPVVKLK